MIAAPTSLETLGKAPGELLDRLSVGDVMHKGVITCPARTPLAQVARIMSRSRIHAVVVWGDEEDDSVGLWGVVSDLDLVVAVARGDVPAGDAVGAANAPVVSVREDMRLREAAELMARCRTAHLVVQDDRLRPVGVLSSLDLARALAGD